MTTRDDLALANHLADAAGAAIRPFFRARYDMEYKADKSPVTQADRAAEAAIRAILENERPGDGIIGEEYGSVREGAERGMRLASGLPDQVLAPTRGMSNRRPLARGRPAKAQGLPHRSTVSAVLYSLMMALRPCCV